MLDGGRPLLLSTRGSSSRSLPCDPFLGPRYWGTAPSRPTFCVQACTSSFTESARIVLAFWLSGTAPSGSRFLVKLFPHWLLVRYSQVRQFLVWPLFDLLSALTAVLALGFGILLFDDNTALPTAVVLAK